MDSFSQAMTASPSTALRKTAEEKTEAVLKTHIRGESIVDSIIPLVDVTKDMLDGTPDSVKPMRWLEMDSRSPGGMSMAFGGSALNYYMHLGRYAITYTRLYSFRITADVNDLLTYKGDVTQLFHDYLIKDIVDQRDFGFLGAARAACGTKNDTSSDRATKSGAVGYTDIGTIGRNAIKAIGQSLADTVNNLPMAKVLINNSTKWEFVGNDHDEVGGARAQDTYFQGPSVVDNVGGVPLSTTTKNRYVAKNEGFIFSEEDVLGHNEVLDDVRFLNQSEGYMLNMLCYGTFGGTLPNSAALSRFNSGGTHYGWTTTELNAAFPSASASASSSASAS